MEPPCAVDQAEISVRKPYEMSATLVLDEPDRLMRRSFTDEDVLASPLDRPVEAHPAHLVIGVVPGLSDPHGRCLAERHMRTLLVVDAAEHVEAVLWCCSQQMAGGFAVSAFNVRCMRSCRPLSIASTGASTSGVRLEAGTIKIMRYGNNVIVSEASLSQFAISTECKRDPDTVLWRILHRRNNMDVEIGSNLAA